MFGLETRKKKKRSVEETFDLELEIANAGQCKQLKEKVEGRMQEIRNTLRAGEQKQDFEQLGILLHGYAALQRLINHLSKKK